jgi:uncharacterized protein (TIRG00374 family)
MDLKKVNFKKIWKFVPIIGLILFIYILISIGVDKIASTFILIPLHIYVLATLPMIIRVLIYGYKWQYISKKQKIDLSFLFCLKITLVCLFYSLVTPGGLGYHIRIFYLQKKAKIPIEKCITNSLIDSVTGSFIGFSFAIIGSVVLFNYFPGMLPIFVILLIINILGFSLFIRKKSGSKFFNILIKPLIPKKYRERFDKSINSFYEDIPRVRDLIVPLLIEVVNWIIIASEVYIIGLAFSIDSFISYPVFILVVTISIMVIGIIPITIGGLGIREGALVVLLLAFGVKQEVAFVISIAGLIVRLLIPAILGMIIAFKENRRYYAG